MSGLGAEALVNLRRMTDKKFNEVSRKRRSVTLAAEKRHRKPQDERIQRDWAEKNRQLKGLESELAELRERMVKSW